jgi:sortase A
VLNDMEKMDKKLIGIAVFVSLIVFTNTAVNALWSGPVEESAPQLQRQVFDSATDSPPAEISIPSIGLVTKVQAVGIGKSGNMAVPDNYQDVGWYRYGTLPGRRGSAVMAGHVNNGFGLGGVFKDLDRLKAGDQVIYKAQDGTLLTFVVEQVMVYDVEHAPTGLIFNQADYPRLNLITCDGEWSERARAYDKRRVVFTRLLEPLHQ